MNWVKFRYVDACMWLANRLAKTAVRLHKTAGCIHLHVKSVLIDIRKELPPSD